MTNSNISNLYDTVSETYDTMTEGPNNVGGAVRKAALGIGAVVMALSPVDAEAQHGEYSPRAHQEEIYQENPLDNKGVLDRNTNEFAKPPYAPRERESLDKEYIRSHADDIQPAKAPVDEGLLLLAFAGAGYAIRELKKEN